MPLQVQVEWQDDVDELRKLYLAEKDYQNRMRLQALWYLRQGRTVGAVAELIGKHPRTIQHWVAWYRKGGVTEVLNRRHGGHLDTATQLEEKADAILQV